MNEGQLELDMKEYGISREQACILCHLSSECGGCCVKCKAEGKSGTCYGQECSLPSRDHDGQRWDAWMHIVSTLLPELERFVPERYRKALKKQRKEKRPCHKNA